MGTPHSLYIFPSENPMERAGMFAVTADAGGKPAVTENVLTTAEEANSASLIKRITVRYLVRLLLIFSVVPFLCNCGGDQANSSSEGNSYQLEFSAETLFTNSTSRGMMMSNDGITLENQILIEDDAPACGYSSKEGSIEVLKEGVAVKKILKIEEIPVGPARIAMLVYPDFPPQPNNGRHLLFTVNGHEIKYEVKHFWTDVPVPVTYLHQGDNIITVRTLEPDTRFKTWIALNENYHIGSSDRLSHPNRSARSVDNGKTWDFDHLGEKGVVDGEYPIRLKLSNYHPSGWLQSPIINMAANSNIDGIKQPVVIENAKLNPEKQLPENTYIEIKARTGTTHFISEDTWEAWEICTNGKIPQSLLKNRFLQFKIVFETNSPSKSPLLKNVNLETRYRIKNKTLSGGIEVADLINKPEILSSFDFEYENPFHPELKKIREKYKLDEVVKGCKTEFEKMLRLKSWVAKQWNWHLLNPGDPNISWDALEILKPDENGKACGGFCIHYAIVYMQVLQSFGFQARIVNANYSVWGGHEMTEVWSNEFGKWILMDPNFDTYFADKATGTPLNALELHNIFLEEYYPSEAIDRNNWSRKDFVKRAETKGVPKSIVCVVGGGAKGGTLKEYEWWKPVVELYAYCGGYGFLSTGYFRMLPRSNFLSKPYPIPVNHGRTIHWGWTGYYNWYDKLTPRAQEYSQFTNRPNDLYWNLNEVDFSASIEDQGKLLISLTTNSPNFDHYELNINGTVKILKENHYLLNLVPGRNDVEMQVVGRMNNKGPASKLAVIYSQPNKSNKNIEIVTTTACWVSPCWGYNASKIVRNSRGELWAINMYGSYPSASAQIYKRKTTGNWEAGRRSEIVFQGDPGYSSFGYDMILGKDGTLNCAYSAGDHQYGKRKEHALTSGLYLSVKHPHDKEWQQYQIHDKAGSVALHISDAGELFAIVTEGEWLTENRTLLKKSIDQGNTWTIINDNLFSTRPDISHQFFLQTV